MTEKGTGEPSVPADSSASGGPANARATSPMGRGGGGGGGEGPTAQRATKSSKGGGGGGGPSAAQVHKLRDANAKYKNLLKMAKERIQAQDDDLEKAKSDARKVREELAAEKMRNAEMATERSRLMMMASSNGGGGPGGPGGGAGGADGGGGSAADDDNCQPVRVYQRIRAENDAADDDDDGAEPDPIGEPDDDDDSASGTVIWALVGYEITPSEDVPVTSPQYRTRRFAEWRKFHTEAELSDHVRRDAGEPVSVPPYSLSPDQSARIESEAKRSVDRITEEFRRFRVRAEVARKQADATVRALHSSNVATTRRRIEGQDLEVALEQARTDATQLSQLRAEMAEQEVKWKEAYDLLLAENNSLKSSGAEALLAAQWRHRYEMCMSEKEDADARLQVEKEKCNVLSDARKAADAGKYEAKYRDLKESFRLYRKKAKEIFEAQQRGGGGVDAGLLHMSDRGTDDAKLSYLRNLMVNYLSSDSAVREHMETAIGTVLKFSDEDRGKIEKAKTTNSSDSWF